MPHDAVPAGLAQLVTRRDLFTRAAAGFAGVALAHLLRDDAIRAASPAAQTGRPHFAPRARSVIQLFQHGGPSHLDLLDPKPELTRQDGKPMPKYFTDLVKLTAHGNLLGSPFRFQRHGQCGIEYSELLPHTA
ncbi:MAG: DUF1501 domain-containing protein, partial [Pirellulaceae bacterium]